MLKHQSQYQSRQGVFSYWTTTCSAVESNIPEKNIENDAYQLIDTNTLSHFGISVSIPHRAAYTTTSAQSFVERFSWGMSWNLFGRIWSHTLMKWKCGPPKINCMMKFTIK
jgi:hypothetical protein